MRVASITTGADTAGAGIAITHAFRRHTDWQVNSLVASQNYIGYPVDDVQPEPGIVGGLPYATRYQVALERLYDAADVVMAHNTTHGHRWYDAGQAKPTVLLHHGMHTLEGYRAIVRDARQRGMVQLGSTLNLSVHEPEVEWLGLPVNIERMRQIRAEHYKPSKALRIGHAPTNRAIKGSDAFDAAVASLRASGLPVEAVVIQGLPWQDCLRLKATCDVFFDQPVLGYGSNAIEAWAMGLPVIAGVQDPAVREAMIERWGVLPFAETTEQTIERSLRALVADADLRAEYTRRGTAHVERWHAESVTVERLKTIYASARHTTPGGREKRYDKAAYSRIARVTARQAVAV